MKYNEESDESKWFAGKCCFVGRRLTEPELDKTPEPEEKPDTPPRVIIILI